MKIKFNDELDDLFEYLSSLGGKCYLVGGAVRDYCLRGFLDVNGDLDFEIHLVDFELLCASVGKFYDYELQGNFGVIILKGLNVQISVPRLENAIGVGHCDFLVNLDPFMGCYQAGLRRDFTVNALLLDVVSGSVIDNYGGLSDLELGVLRHVGDKFVEDGLRVFRGIRFAARFDFEIDSGSWGLFFEMRDCVLGLSSDRVYQELVLFFNEPYAGDKLCLLVELLSFYLDLSLDCVLSLLSGFEDLSFDVFLIVCCYFVDDVDGLFRFCGVGSKRRRLIGLVCKYLQLGDECFYEVSSLKGELFDVCIGLFGLLGYDADLMLKRAFLVRSLKCEYKGSYFVELGFRGSEIAVMQRDFIVKKVSECYE